MAIEEDIIKAINANLTAEVSSRIKVRIQQAEDDARRLLLLEKELKAVKEELQVTKTLVSTEERLNEKIRKYEETKTLAQEATLAKSLVDQTLKFADLRVADMKELVKDVFANSRYKYQMMESGTTPVATQNGSYPVSAPTSKTTVVEGQGTP